MASVSDPPVLGWAQPAPKQKHYSTRFRKAFASRVRDMGTAVHEEIYRILAANGVGNTQNKYGIHVELSGVDDAVMGQLADFVDYCASKDQDLRSYDERLEQYRLHRRYQELPYEAEASLRPRGVREDDADASDDEEDGATKAVALAPPIAAEEKKKDVSPAVARLFATLAPLEDAAGKKRSSSNMRFAAMKKRFAKGKRVDRRGAEWTAERQELQPEPYLLFN